MLIELTVVMTSTFSTALMAPPPGGSGGGGGLLSTLLLLAVAAGIVYFVVKKMNVRNGTPSQVTTPTGSNESLFSQAFYLIGSLVVVISFFLPWGSSGNFFGVNASVSGFELVRVIFSMLDDSVLKRGDVTLIVVATLLFLLSPIVCHVISLLQLLAHSLPARFILIFPLVVWILEGLYLLFRTQGELLRAVEFASFGFIGTVIGMLVAAFPLLPADKSQRASTSTSDSTTQEFCVKCGTKLLADSTYCGKCGAKTEVRQTEASDSEEPLEFCYHCGKELAEKVSTCPHCGKQL